MTAFNRQNGKPVHRLRLLLVSFIDDCRWTGMGKWTHAIAEQLRARGHRVDLWFANDFPTVRRLGRLASLILPSALTAKLLASRSRFDAAIVHEPSAAVCACLRRLRFDLPPVVAMCHNVESHVFRTKKAASRRGFAELSAKSHFMHALVRRPLTDGAIRWADSVVCLSDVDRMYIRNSIGIPDRRITVVTNGVGPEYFTPRPDGTSFGRVLFVGGWLDVKGRRLLPRIWEQVVARFPHARLSVVGSGASATDVLEDFPEPIRPSIAVTPRLARPGQMATCYAEHDLYLMTSLTEGSPLSLLEAMAAGMPVAAARVGGIPDIITEKYGRLMFPPCDFIAAADAIGRLLSDTSAARETGMALRARAAELTWDAAASRLEAVAIAVSKRGVTC
ncbi:MAG TPA: glycosyltransferase family 4 protein [Gemmataceae bacterium]|nr:glycosyltransferase family 4 protein [Gemmataceae bacterium]